MTESSMWRWLSKARGPFMLTRTENLVSSGEPDVWGYHRDYGVFWIELKQADTPKGVKMRQSQIRWFSRMSSLGCRKHWILIRFPHGYYLVPGKLIRNIREIDYKSSVKELDYNRFQTGGGPTELITTASKGW